MKTKLDEIMQRLQCFSPKIEKDYVTITLPVVILTNNGLLDLRIMPNDWGFTICCTENLFVDTNRSQQWFFDVFEKNDKNYHYGMQIENGIFLKNYDKECNLVVAIDEFIRFFILLDDFVINNDIVGHEENYDKN